MAKAIRIASLVVACAAGAALGSGCVVREEVVVVPRPPADQVEEPGPTPGTEYVWIRGRWAWNGRAWVWRHGHWEVSRPSYRPR